MAVVCLKSVDKELSSMATKALNGGHFVFGVTEDFT